MGPFEKFYDAATGGQGILGVRGVKKERELTDRLIEQVQATQELEGLFGMAESGRGAMTRDQHLEFRAALTQEAVNQETLGEAFSLFSDAQTGLRSRVVTAGDTEQLDLLDAQALKAQKLMRSVDPQLRQMGGALLSSLMAEQRQYAATNETQRMELEAAEESGRNSLRQEFQSEINNRFIGPMLEDRAQYETIAAQLKDGDGEMTAPPALVTMVLDYAGASLRQSDDGDWGFSFGGLSIGDKAVPDMTYSQLRNQLEQAHSGRDGYMQRALGEYGQSIAGQKFGVNGSRITDLAFPLASRAYDAQEPAFVPKPLDPQATADKVSDAASTIGSTAAELARRSGAVDVVSNAMTGLRESFANIFKSGQAGAQIVQPPEPLLPGPPQPRRAPGMRRGVWVPPFMRRQTNGD